VKKKLVLKPDFETFNWGKLAQWQVKIKNYGSTIKEQ
jgi:hypothetical protein